MPKRFYLLALLCFVGAVIPLYYNGLHTPLLGRDFTAFWLAGRGVRSGVNVFNHADFMIFVKKMVGDRLLYWAYPPPMLFVAVPISLLSYKVAFVVWDVATVALFYIASKPFLRPDLRLLAIVTPAAILSMIFGQTGLLVGALWFFAFRWAPLSALLMIKPHLGFLAGIRVLRDRRLGLLGLLFGAAIVGASAVVFGGWWDFLSSGAAAQSRALWDRSLITWVLVSTAPGVGYGLYGWLLFAAGAAYFLAKNFNVWTAATAAMLISPYGFHYDMTVICVGFLVLLYERDLRFWQVAIIVAAFLSPAWVRVFGTWFVPPFLLAALAIQTDARRTDDVGGESARHLEPCNELEGGTN